MSANRDAVAPPPRPPTPGELVLYRACRVISVGASRVMFPGKVIGRENLPATGAYILAPVHRSYVDWLVVARVTKRRLRYIAKAEIWKSRPVGALIGALGAFPVNRSGADREALERCRMVLAGGEPLVMFPEGTRRSGPKVEDLREGVAYLALHAGVPVVAVGIGGSEDSMPRGAKVPRPHRVDLVIAPPLVPPSAEGRREGRGGGGGDGEPGTATRPARISRRSVRDFSDSLEATIQSAFDEAQGSVYSRRSKPAE
ncbi:MAG: lysophospholipid acyltransferase family protein [Acidimicrobiales bacterium]